MKLLAIATVIALTGSAGFAVANQSGGVKQPANAIELLSQATGLTTREVNLALGPSANYESPVKYASANRRFRQAVGRTLYEQIMGRGVLGAQQMRALRLMAQARQAGLAAGK